MEVAKMTLRNGREVPALGLGTWQAEPGVVGDAVISAIKAGYRHFDCSPIYQNEKEIGEAFARAFSEGLVKREELFITSKLWCDKHERHHVVPALRQTLADLQLDYLDLYLVHWPVALKHGKVYPKSADDFLQPHEAPLTETWSAMEECLELGLTRHIGVSNFSLGRLERLISVAKHAPEVNQVECHPFHIQEELLRTCKNHGVLLTAYCPLGTGKSEDEDVPCVFQNEVLAKIAERHICSPAQVALAWAIGRETAVIPKSVDEDRQRENLAAGSIRLCPEEMKMIDELDLGHRFMDGSTWTRNDSPYSHEWLWEGDEIC